jgi:enediyne biosynthesis protein E2
MPPIMGSIRRLLLAPSLENVGFVQRGFPGASSAAARRLETIPQAVVCGFEWGIEASRPWEVERRLSMVEPGLRGFAYEGATMAYTVRDAMGRGHRARDLLLGPGQPHIFLAYIGIGFAMARLPRKLWAKVLPDLGDSPYYPTMSWLAVDGYGFDLAYFDVGRWVEEQRVPRPYPWQDDPGYFPRAVDQGIGRALWFIHGARAADVAAAVDRFADRRRADLWSGVGLAAAFAGGCDDGGLAALRRLAGRHAAELAQGAVFAAKARSYAGFVPDETEATALALTGLSAESAAALADDRAVPRDAAGPVPPYEMWRGNVREYFLSAPDRVAG